MKIATVRDSQATPVWGVTDGHRFVAANVGADAAPADLVQALESGSVAAAATVAAAALAAGNGEVLEPSALLPPLPALRRNVFCLGPNYADHAAESRNSPGAPAEPLYFTKATGTLAPPVHLLHLDRRLTTKLDWELELAVVIGTSGRDIPAASALDHVLGYTVAIDFSARDVQGGRPEGQWFLGKSIDGFYPMGPWIVTADEITDPQSLDLRLSVNGVVKQKSSTAAMIFPIDHIIADLSRYVTLQPGDVISTGTPAGVGDAMNPPEYLQHGDHVTAVIAGIGQLDVDVQEVA